MKRGELWTVAGGHDYAGKPAVIVQDDRFDATQSITICVVTTDLTEAPLFRIPLTPTPKNGLNSRSSLTVDKITTVPRNKLGHFIGQLDDADMLHVNRAILVFLGLAG